MGIVHIVQRGQVVVHQDQDVAVLIDQARQGSKSALGELIGTLRAYLLYVANQKVGNQLKTKVATSDVVQDACLRAHERFNQFRGTTEPELRAWMRSILINSLSDSHRKYVTSKKRGLDREVVLDQPSNLRDADLTPRSSALAHEEANLLRSAMERLSPDAQKVLRLRNWDLLPFAEIGEQMDRSADAAQKLWSRAVKELEKELSTHST